VLTKLREFLAAFPADQFSESSLVELPDEIFSFACDNIVCQLLEIVNWDVLVSMVL
jgi:hypothetical protein